MKKRRSRLTRPTSELHRGPWQHIPRVGGSAESDFTIRGGAWFSLPRGRHLVLFLVALLGAGLWTAYFAWSRTGSLFEFLGAIGVIGRGFAVVVGGLGVILAVAYYYTAGIDWPRETAGRLLLIGSVIGLVVVAAIVGLAFLEDRFSEFWPFVWKASLALALLASLGILMQRR